MNFPLGNLRNQIRFILNSKHNDSENIFITRLSLLYTTYFHNYPITGLYILYLQCECPSNWISNPGAFTTKISGAFMGWQIAQKEAAVQDAGAALTPSDSYSFGSEGKCLWLLSEALSSGQKSQPPLRSPVEAAVFLWMLQISTKHLPPTYLTPTWGGIFALDICLYITFL